MQNVLEFSSVVDRLRSNSGSALKSLQKNFEETALKAAGLGEDEEALYKLSKHTQAYLRAADAMQQAASTLADDFAEAVEDLALREVARKFRDASKSASTQQLAALNIQLDKPVKQACDADNYATRQKLIGQAFAGLLDVNLECFRAASTSLEDAFTAAQQLLKDQPKPKPATVGGSRATDRRATAPPTTGPAPSAPAAAMGHTAATPAVAMGRTATTPAATAPKVASSAPLDDLLDMGGGGISSTKGSDTKGTTNLLDFDDFGSAAGSGFSLGGVSGTSSPPDFGGISSGGGISSSPHRASTSSIPLDFDFHSPGVSNGYAGAGSSPSPVSVPSVSSSDLGSLGGMSWPTKEEEDESCIKARVDMWQQGKNIRAMLVSLHEVAPSCSGWAPVKFDDVQEPSDVKSVYRRAVLAVHPDKHNGKAGEKVLGHLVFQALCDQWNIFRASS